MIVLLCLFFAAMSQAAPHPALMPIIENLKAHPEWILTDLANQQAIGKHKQSIAPFTPRLTGSYKQYSGPYNRDVQQHGMELQTAIGPSLALGWQSGIGTFPSYDQWKTQEMGEAYVRVEIPLLDGFWFNTPNIEMQKAELDIDVQQFEQELQLLDLIFATEWTFWHWQKALALEQIALENLNLAKQRQHMFEKQYAIGTMSKLSVIDNERELQEREILWREAQQYTVETANKLGYFWRSEDGAMSIPTNNLILSLIDPNLPSPPLKREWDLSRRPDIMVWSPQIEQIEKELQLIKAKRLPKINLVVSSDKSIQNPTYSESYIGFKYLHDPLMQEERGKQMALEAKLQSLYTYQQKLQDKAQQDVKTLHQSWLQLIEQSTLQEKALDLAEEALRLEQIRFNNGGSDLLDLLKRENNLLKAKSTMIKLQIDTYLTEVQWRRVLGTSPL